MDAGLHRHDAGVEHPVLTSIRRRPESTRAAGAMDAGLRRHDGV
jgi:hypothetical protein